MWQNWYTRHRFDLIYSNDHFCLNFDKLKINCIRILSSYQVEQEEGVVKEESHQEKKGAEDETDFRDSSNAGADPRHSLSEIGEKIAVEVDGSTVHFAGYKCLNSRAKEE